jgi:hypothetical protein
MFALKTAAISAATLVLIGLATAPAYADDESETEKTRDVSVEVTGSSLSLSIPDEISGFDFSLADEDLDDEDSLTQTQELSDDEATAKANLWTVVDPRGTGVAWSLSVAASDFTMEGSTSTISGNILNIDSYEGLGLVSLNSDYASGVTSPTTGTAKEALGKDASDNDDTGIHVILSGKTAAAQDGSKPEVLPSMGAYSFTPLFSITLPGTAYATATNPYVSTLTVTLA